MPHSQSTQQTSPSWWTFPHVWMVIAGPAIVVVASFVTFFLAAHGADPVTDEDYYRKGVEINRTLEATEGASLAPALQARNHAATGVVPVTKR